MIRYVAGDVLEPEGEGKKIIAHVVNDVGAWGAGFVTHLSRKWPVTEQCYRDVCRDYHIGEVFYVPVETKPNLTWVANMFAQRGLRSPTNPVPLDYEALAYCLEDVDLTARFNGFSLHIPRIGCGLAGGNWHRVEKLLEHFVSVDVTVYDLPVARGHVPYPFKSVHS